VSRPFTPYWLPLIMYISPRHHPPREPQRLALCLIDCSLGCTYSRCSAPHLPHPSFLSGSAISICLPSFLAASYIPALHSLIECLTASVCLTESMCLTEFMPSNVLNGTRFESRALRFSCVQTHHIHTRKRPLQIHVAWLIQCSLRSHMNVRSPS
jgi:hypothetical protein